MTIAVVLSGCGVFDGAEIHESVLTLLALAKAGVDYQCVAPNIEQHHVINHLTGEEDTTASRNVLVESARIARGDIKSLDEVDTASFTAAIIPGGFGAAKNLCDFALKGTDCEVNAAIKQFVSKIHAEDKPLGFICIAPAMIPKIINQPVTLTIGNDVATAAAINQMGGQHQDCVVTECVIDDAHKIVTTPAYMLAQNILEAAEGIEKCVSAVLKMR